MVYAAQNRRPQLLPMSFPIVYEDPDLIVIDKPAGLLDQHRSASATAVGNGAAARTCRKADPLCVGLIHWLDRDASGLLVFSKNHDAFRSLKLSSSNTPSIESTWPSCMASSNPRPTGSTLGWSNFPMVRLIQPNGDHGELATTDYQVIQSKDGISLVKVTLQTGRKHQIRVHLSERGTPILGDTVYAPQTPRPPLRLLLTATELSLVHPRSGKRLHFQIEILEEMRGFFC